MKVLTTFLVCCLLFATMPAAFAQTDTPAATKPTSPQMAFGLLDGTPIKLRIGRTVSSADAKTGESVDFEVLEEVKVGDVIVIPRGGIALATVTEAHPKRRMGRGGKLNINIDYVRLVSGEKAALRAVKETKGGGHVGAMTGAIVVSSILFFPAAPFFLFIKGKDITIPKGTEITAYINGDTSLDPKQFAPNTGPGTIPAVGIDQKQASDDSTSSSISVKSTPDGAEIEVDGKFVGSTPSTVQLKIGDHKITIRKAGFVVWERAITVSAGGSIVVDASLEKNP